MTEALVIYEKQTLSKAANAYLKQVYDLLSPEVRAWAERREIRLQWYPFADAHIRCQRRGMKSISRPEELAEAINIVYRERHPLKASEHVHAIPGDGVTDPVIPVAVVEPCVPTLKLVRPEACLAAGAELGPIKTTEALYRCMAPLLVTEDQECFYMVPLDLRFHTKGVVEVHRGARSHVEVTRVDFLRAAIVSGAAYVFAVHNHPSGVAKPSAADRHLHKVLEKAAASVEMKLLDSVIIGRKEFFSIRSNQRGTP